jgi:hypothetical protein
VDLLGFSNQLALSRCDIRAQAGEQAIERLSSLEKALQMLEEEKIRFPQLYPSGLRYNRLNDALFFGIDVEHLLPPTGQITLTGGYSADELLKSYAPNGNEVFSGTIKESAGEVAKFLGLVARVHSYINAREAEKSFPGCRTVVASGLRKCFKDRHGSDDFFAANFSISVAFEAQEKGAQIGIKGNSLYIEDDVAVAVSYVNACHAIIALSKFHHLHSPGKDPYTYPCKKMTVFAGSSWTTHEPVVVEVMKQQYVFRRLNPSVLTNLQLFEDYRRLAEEETSENSRGQLMRDALNGATPTLEELNNILRDKLRPFLLIHFGLDSDYSTFFGTPQMATE